MSQLPGRYPWHDGMRITDLIPNREFLITREYWTQQNAITLQMQASGTRLTGALNDVRRNAPGDQLGLRRHSAHKR